MTLATEIVPAAPATAPNETAHEGTHPAAQAPASTPVASETTANDATTEPVDWKARHDKLISESIPTLQSKAAKAENEVTTLKSENTDLKAKLAEIGDPEEIEYEVAHERDMAYLGFLEDVMGKGYTLRQVVDKLRNDIRSASGERAQSETKKQSVEGLIALVDNYDKGYATFLRAMSKNGSPITHETIAGTLRELYGTFHTDGATPAQAASAAAAAPAAEAPKEPPVVANAGAAQKISGSPVFKPGMRARDYFGQALASGLGTRIRNRPTS